MFAELLTLNMHVQIRVSNFKLQQKGFSLLSGLKIKKSVPFIKTRLSLTFRLPLLSDPFKKKNP
jgi:hypothetical protein